MYVGFVAVQIENEAAHDSVIRSMFISPCVHVGCVGMIDRLFLVDGNSFALLYAFLRVHN